MTNYFVWMKASQIADRDYASVTLPLFSGSVTVHPLRSYHGCSVCGDPACVSAACMDSGFSESKYAGCEMGIFDDYEFMDSDPDRDHEIEDEIAAEEARYNDEMDRSFEEHFDEKFRQKWGYSRRSETKDQRAERERKERAEARREQRNHEMGTTSLGDILKEALIKKATANSGQAAGLNIQTDSDPRKSFARI